VGAVRLLRQPLAVVLGAAPAPGLHPAGPARRLRPTGAKADERDVLASLLAASPDLAAARPGQVIIGDKNYYGTAFEATMAAAGITLLRPARKREPPRPGARFFRPLRQVIESVNDTFKGQPGLERHGGHTPGGVIVRVLQRILALTTAIWHNDATGQPVLRSLTAYDH
jgi:hypothetical protein